MDPQLLVTVLGAGGGGAVLLALINGLFKWLSGSSHRERVRNTDLASQRTKAIEERDEAEANRKKEAKEAELELEKETRRRRDAEEYIALLTYQLILAGIQPVAQNTRI